MEYYVKIMRCRSGGQMMKGGYDNPNQRCILPSKGMGGAKPQSTGEEGMITGSHGHNDEGQTELLKRKK